MPMARLTRWPRSDAATGRQPVSDSRAPWPSALRRHPGPSARIATLFRMSRRTAVTALIAYLAVLAGVTLGSSPGTLLAWGARTVRRVECLEFVTSGDVERASNVLLFAPAGLLLCYALPAVSRWFVWVLCVAVSGSIEAAQLVLPGRDPSAVDIVTNATGAAIGVLVHFTLTRRRGR
jgi:glycopeptide antibiotics resistance protein